MPSLSRDHRRLLENTVAQARTIAVDGARKVLTDQYAVHHHEPWPHMKPEDRELRNQLRAHGRQLGDRRDERRDTQEMEHLVQACAYEHWHRMLFARFLAENDLLLDADHGMAMSLDEVRELAREQNRDWLEIAAAFAQKMLLAVFRADDPVLRVSLPPETRQKLEEKLAALPGEVFRADDSLGWVYQFWQKDEKDRVNKSEVKIGADELPAVTQLFTEDYMVLFLLENTLGAWWTAKRRAEGRDSALPGYEWTYLRLNEDGSPAAGAYDGWPRTARELRVLDPSMGSGHFLTFALPILARMRVEEEGLTLQEAIGAVLGENLYGLELDARCSQIAAFNLALAAWRLAGEHFALPAFHLACSGIGIHAPEQEWTRLGGADGRKQDLLRWLYSLFRNAPTLGSLIDPLRVGMRMVEDEIASLMPLLEAALDREGSSGEARELAIAARGVLTAFRILTGRFTLVATNVPYLGRGKQDAVLAGHCAEFYGDGKADLATAFVDRCLRFCDQGGSVALVTPQNWLFLTSYRKLRERLLKDAQWDFVARVGEHAFDSPAAAGAFVAMLGLTSRTPSGEHRFAGWDVGEARTAVEKAVGLASDVGAYALQTEQTQNPDSAIVLKHAGKVSRLAQYASIYQGVSTTDMPRFVEFFWEQALANSCWEYFQMAPSRNGISDFCGLLLWEGGKGELARIGTAQKGLHVVGKKGLAIAVTRQLYRSFFFGNRFDGTLAAVIPHSDEHLAAIAACVQSDEFPRLVREVDQALSVTESSFGKIPFDLDRWRMTADKEFSTGLPEPHSEDPTQWFFSGHPRASECPLQVGVARLAGYRWPRQSGASFAGCPATGTDGLEAHADGDGIAPLYGVAGEASAAERLRALLADAYGDEWSAAKLQELLGGWASLEEWLRDGFFEEHCRVFHQRPFVWHVWDGRKDGFHALVNYHKLVGPNGEGRKTLEKLLYTYLGRWIERQGDEVRAGKEGADARLGAAVHLKSELEKILAGESPYDIFVRWKPLHEQAIGWAPDINDGVRLNIRPWLTAKPYRVGRRDACILRVTPRIQHGKDRGKEPHRPKEDFPWFWSWDEGSDDFAGGTKFDGARWNDLHYSLAKKRESRSGRSKEGVGE